MIGYSKPRKPAQCLSNSALEAPTQPVPGAGVTRDVHWPLAGERVGPEPWSQARQHRQRVRARGRRRRGSKETAGKYRGGRRGSCQTVRKERAGLASIWGSLTLGPPEQRGRKAFVSVRQVGAASRLKPSAKCLSHKTDDMAGARA